MGKLIKQSRGEVKLCAQIARYYADNAKSFLAPVKYPSELGEAWVEHHPIGVLLAVEPWNFPYYQLIRVLAPNLAAGNPVIAKHASIVPHCAETFAHLVREAGAPEGVDQPVYLPGSGGEDYRRRSRAGRGAHRVGESRQRGGGAGGEAY